MAWFRHLGWSGGEVSSAGLSISLFSGKTSGGGDWFYWWSQGIFTSRINSSPRTSTLSPSNGSPNRLEKSGSPGSGGVANGGGKNLFSPIGHSGHPTHNSDPGSHPGFNAPMVCPDDCRFSWYGNWSLGRGFPRSQSDFNCDLPQWRDPGRNPG